VVATGLQPVFPLAIGLNRFSYAFASHAAVFPQCAAIIHHGGAGTTFSALRGGAPSVILSDLADQPFWGRLLAQQGLSPPCLLLRDYRDSAIDRAIVVATGGPLLRRRVSELSQRLRAEDGVAAAIEIMSSHGLLPCSNVHALPMRSQ
jgi:sterol 3beta-glucosyltransferase